MEINWREKLLFQQVSIAPLVVFRIIFGSIILFGTLRFMLYGWVDFLYIQPKFFFTYWGFDWVKPLPGAWIYLPFVLLALSGLFVLVGFLYRFASVLLFLSFTYIELLDKTNYLNHYYFVSLVAFILCFLPANRWFSLDSKWGFCSKSTSVPLFTIRLLQFQLGVVYFFAGVAKLNSDWLFRAEPLRSWLNGFDNLPFIGNLLAQEWVAYAFAWIGCIYDLAIFFLLLKRKTRPLAYFVVVIFHLLTWWLFPIGIFPWVMVLSTLIFFSAEFHEKILQFVGCKFVTEVDKAVHSRRNSATFFIGIFVVFQLLVPMRYLLYSGNLLWNEEGFRFSWRVMLMQKTGVATFYVVDKQTQRSLEVNNRYFITQRQEAQMATQPDMILQFAHHLYTIYKDTVLRFGNQRFHLKDPAIKAAVFVSLNGRPNQPFVLPKEDLAELPYNLKHRTWLEPYQENE